LTKHQPSISSLYSFPLHDHCGRTCVMTGAIQRTIQPLIGQITLWHRNLMTCSDFLPRPTLISAGRSHPSLQ